MKKKNKIGEAKFLKKNKYSKNEINQSSAALFIRRAGPENHLINFVWPNLDKISNPIVQLFPAVTSLEVII